MSAHTAQQSVGEVDGFIDMLRAACSERAVYDRLQGVLALPSAQRRNLVHSWVNEMIVAQAPDRLIQAIACLKSDTVATRAYMVLSKEPRPQIKSFGSIGVPLYWILATLSMLLLFIVMSSLAFSARSDAPSWEQLALIVLIPALAGVWLAWGYRYLRQRVQPRPRVMASVLAAGLIGGGVLATLSVTQASIAGCRSADQLYRDASYEGAIAAYSYCLSFSALTVDARASALAYRAALHYRLGATAQGVADQQAAFQLKPPKTPRQYLDFAARCRTAGRYQDGLDAILAAERLPGDRGKAHLPYYKGWLLYELGRYAEARDVLSEVLSKWPQAAAAYVPRGLAYEKLGDLANAKNDYTNAAEQFATLMSEARWLPGEVEKKYLTILREKLQQHDLLRLHPAFEHRTRNL